MSIATLLDKIKNHPDFQKAGMVLCHNGVVRGTARDGAQLHGHEVVEDRAVAVIMVEGIDSGTDIKGRNFFQIDSGSSSRSLNSPAPRSHSPPSRVTTSPRIQSEASETR